MTAVTRARTACRAGPLAVRDFRLLTAGQLTSTVGDYCFVVALPWLVLSTAGGAVRLGIVMACYGLARGGMLTAGGTLADKIGPRLTMLGTDLGRLVVLITLAAASATHTDSLPVLCALAAALGAGAGLFFPASMSIMPTLLPPGQLSAGNGLYSAATQAGSSLGPILGGAIVAIASPAPAFIIDGASFAVSALSLALIGRQPSVTTPIPTVVPPGPRESLLRLLKRWRVLRLVLAQITVASLAFGGTFEIALPALAHLHFGAAAYGALLGSLGAGAILGNLTAARAQSSARPMVAASASFLGQAAAISLVPFLGGLLGALAATLSYGACNGFGNVVFQTAIQRTAPSHLLGRVMSLILLANWGTLPVSVIVAGIAVHKLGPAPFFPIAGIALAIPLLAALTQHDYRELAANPSGQTAQ